MSELVTTPVPRWVAELKSPPPPRTKNATLPDPPGYIAQATSGKKGAKDSKSSLLQQQQQQQQQRSPQQLKAPSADEMDRLKLKKAWEMALGPIKSLPMTGFMMYMTGNSLQIFSIMMVYMAFKNPIVGILATNQAFERFETDTNKTRILQVKLAYIAMQMVALALGVWKVNGMGLLPTTRSDWLLWETQRTPLEFAVPAI